MLLVIIHQVGIIRFEQKGEALGIFMYAFMGKRKARGGQSNSAIIFRSDFFSAVAWGGGAEAGEWIVRHLLPMGGCQGAPLGLRLTGGASYLKGFVQASHPT